MKKEYHKFNMVGGVWFFTCAKVSIMQTRCDEKFTVCPYCGEELFD